MISRKLDQWLQAGLLTSAQQEAILTYEVQHPQRANTWLYTLMLLGALIIGLGIISLIAANWAYIPEAIKLGIDFTLLISLAIGIYWQYPNRQTGLWFELFLAGFLILCLATIGLIAQIYHLGGKWYHALLWWAAITSIASLFSRNLLTRFLWITLLLHALLWTLVNLNSNSTSYWYENFPAIFLLAPLLSAVFYFICTKLVVLRTFKSSLFFWFQISAIMALAFIDIARSGGELNQYSIHNYIPAYLAAIGLGIGILLNKHYKVLNKILLLSALGLLLLYYYPDAFFTGQQRYALFGGHTNSAIYFWQADDIRAPFLTLLILFLYAIHVGNVGYQRIFNTITFLIGLRFVILYFQAMGGLAATGIGLIISGSLIIGLAWLWYKQRDKLRAWTEELEA